MGADDERATLLLQVLEIDPGAPRAVRVEGRRRLVGEHEPWPVQRRPDQGDLLPHAFGEGAQPPVAGVGELEDLEQVVDAAAPHRGLDVVDGAEVVQVGASRHPLIEAGDLGHESDPGSNRSRIVPGVDAVDFDRARRGQQDASHAA